MVADLDVGDALTDTLYDSASLVSEHHREVAFGVVTGQLNAQSKGASIFEKKGQSACFDSGRTDGPERPLSAAAACGSRCTHSEEVLCAVA